MTEAELKERLERAKAKILAGQENITVEEVVENVMPEADAALRQWQGELRQTGLPEADIEIKIGRLLGRVFHPGWAPR